MLVAFTLTPALSARLLKRKIVRKHAGAPNQGGSGHHSDGWTERLYVRSLNWSMAHRWVIVTVCFATLGSTFIVNKYIGRDWMPQEDQSELGVWLEMPEGTSLEATEKTSLELGRKLAAIPGVKGVMASSSAQMIVRVTMAFMTLLLDEPSKRADISEMGQKVRAVMKDYAFARPRLTFPNALGGRDTFAPIRAMLLGPEMLPLVGIAKDVSARMMAEPALTDVKANLNLNNPELQVNIDRQLASDLGVRVADVAGAVRLLMSGEDQISTFKEGSEQYPVTMRLMPSQRDDPAALSRLLVPSAKQGLIRLDSIANLERGLGPSRIEADSSVILSASPACHPGASPG
jgi:HAE1 family hydrophobic/amphiphilic exporter-1